MYIYTYIYIHVHINTYIQIYISCIYIDIHMYICAWLRYCCVIFTETLALLRKHTALLTFDFKQAGVRWHAAQIRLRLVKHKCHHICAVPAGTYMNTYTYTYTYTCACTHIHTCAYKCHNCRYTYVYLYSCIYTYTHTYPYTYICLYI